MQNFANEYPLFSASYHRKLWFSVCWTLGIVVGLLASYAGFIPSGCGVGDSISARTSGFYSFFALVLPAFAVSLCGCFEMQFPVYVLVFLRGFHFSIVSRMVVHATGLINGILLLLPDVMFLPAFFHLAFCVALDRDYRSRIVYYVLYGLVLVDLQILLFPLLRL